MVWNMGGAVNTRRRSSFIKFLCICAMLLQLRQIQPFLIITQNEYKILSSTTMIRLPSHFSTIKCQQMRKRSGIERHSSCYKSKLTRIRQHDRRRFRSFSSTLDDFLEGGDMQRLIDELTDQEQQKLEDDDENIRKHSKTTESINRIEAIEEKKDTSDKSDGWIQLTKIKYNDLNTILETSSSNQSTSPVDVYHNIKGRSNFWIKRDDLLKLSPSGISGNKARKMWAINHISISQFPQCIVSYGGPQSNSMLALAAIVNSKNREYIKATRDEDCNNIDDEDSAMANAAATGPYRFVYYTKTLPRFLKKQPNGNLFRALSLGMELIQITPQEYRALFEEYCDNLNRQPPMDLQPPIMGNSLWIPQGGAFSSAIVGAYQQARDIYSFWKQHGEGRSLSVCVPGGTCTTALLLHHGLKQLQEQEGTEIDFDNNDDIPDPMDVQVVVIPCVGDASYARRQMMSLNVEIGADPSDIPTILSPEPEISTKSASSRAQKYFTFGQPHEEILDTFQSLRDDHDIVVDLLYGAPSFAIIWRHLEQEQQQEQPLLSMDVLFDPNQPLAGREIMYVHSGGLEGISSQLLRYKYEGMVEIDEVQLPGRYRN